MFYMAYDFFPKLIIKMDRTLKIKYKAPKSSNFDKEHWVK